MIFDFRLQFDRLLIPLPPILMAHIDFEYAIGLLSIDQSTYGLRVLLMRFENLPFHKKLIHSLATSILFSLGRILGGSNHMTVYAQKPTSEAVV